MKKKFLTLVLGIAGLASVSYAQPGPGNGYSTAGVTINGAPVVAGSAIALNSVITWDGRMFVLTQVPDTQIDDATSETLEQNITIALIQAMVVVDLNGNGVNNTTGIYGNEPGRNGDAYFGFDINNYTLQVIPFDFGLSAVLGAGALAAVRTARKRRKEQATVIA